MKKPPFSEAPSFASYIKERWDINPLRDAEWMDYVCASQMADQIINKYKLTAPDKKSLFAAMGLAAVAGHKAASRVHRELDEARKGAGTAAARAGKNKDSALVDKIILHRTKEYLQRPTSRTRMHAIAQCIYKGVQVDLKESGIKGIGDKAIERRLTRLLKRPSA
jgi:hypothetical protein